jgi:hypothetical protein
VRERNSHDKLFGNFPGSGHGGPARGVLKPARLLHLQESFPRILMNKERLIPLIVASALFMENKGQTS